MFRHSLGYSIRQPLRYAASSNDPMCNAQTHSGVVSEVEFCVMHGTYNTGFSGKSGRTLNVSNIALVE